MNAPGTPSQTDPAAPEGTTNSSQGAPDPKSGTAAAGPPAPRARARRARAQPTPLAVFCARASDASRLQEEAAWFDPSLRVAVFPDWETLPYDAFSPHH